MLDDNVRVLGRRINDLEIENTDKKDKIRTLKKQLETQQMELDSIYDTQSKAREDLDAQITRTVDLKDQEIRRLKTERQNAELKRETEGDHLKTQHKHELEMIQDKVQTALAKKKEVIEQLGEELRLKDLQIMKLKDLMQKQRA